MNKDVTDNKLFRKMKSDYGVLKGLRDTKRRSSPEEMHEIGEQDFGWLKAPLIEATNFVVKYALENELHKRGYYQVKNDVKYALGNEEIKSLLAKKTSGGEILTEDLFLEKSFETLTDEQLKKDLLISSHPMFLAAVAFEISEMGIENFAGAKKTQ